MLAFGQFEEVVPIRQITRMLNHLDVFIDDMRQEILALGITIRINVCKLQYRCDTVMCHENSDAGAIIKIA